MHNALCKNYCILRTHCRYIESGCTIPTAFFIKHFYLNKNIIELTVRKLKIQFDKLVVKNLSSILIVKGFVSPLNNRMITRVSVIKHKLKNADTYHSINGELFVTVSPGATSKDHTKQLLNKHLMNYALQSTSALYRTPFTNIARLFEQL